MILESCVKNGQLAAASLADQLESDPSLFSHHVSWAEDVHPTVA